jgi:TRAP-type C4-dicarboxylate transport system permease small subunit
MNDNIVAVAITSSVIALALVVVGMLGLIAILCRMFLKVDFSKDRLQAEVHDPSLSSYSAL